MDPKRLLRINVVGSSGSGKSTFSKKLAAKLNSPYVEMDLLFWKPNWTMPSDEEFFPKLEKAVSQERWILDGNYGRTQDLKWKYATAVIWLNYSFPRNLWQSCSRAFIRSLNRKEMWPDTGNRETFLRVLNPKKSIIWWMIQNFEKIQERYRATSQDPKYAHILFIEIKSPREAKTFLDSLKIS